MITGIDYKLCFALSPALGQSLQYWIILLSHQSSDFRRRRFSAALTLKLRTEYFSPESQNPVALAIHKSDSGAYPCYPYW